MLESNKIMDHNTLQLLKVAEDDRINIVPVHIGILTIRTELEIETLFDTVLDVIKSDESEGHCYKPRRYLFMEGNLQFTFYSKNLIFNEDQCYTGIQTLAGSGGLMLVGRLLKNLETTARVYVPVPTWEPHITIMEGAGLSVKTFKYLNDSHDSINMNNFIHTINLMSPHDSLLLQLSGHNPTGLDLTYEQWMEIISAIRQRDAHIIIDVTYIGLCTTIENDVKPLKLLGSYHKALIVLSYSKILSLYSERVGSLFYPTAREDMKLMIRKIIRSSYSSPPGYGVTLALKVLTNPITFDRWKEDLNRIVQETNEIRAKIIELVGKYNPYCNKPLNVNSLKRQRGIFLYPDLDESETIMLVNKFGIYLGVRGRITLIVLNKLGREGMVDFVTKAIFYSRNCTHPDISSLDNYLCE